MIERTESDVKQTQDFLHKVEKKEQVKHTPGTWLTKWNGAYGHVICGGSSGSYLATVSGLAPGISTDEGKANARLIAAAPELLEAAKKALEKYCGCHSSESGDWHSTRCHVPALKAAIAKAEGR